MGKEASGYVILKQIRYLVFSGALLLVAPVAAAVAQTPSQDAYAGALGEQVGGGGGVPGASGGGVPAAGVEQAGNQVVNASGSGLPFTGLDLAIIVLIGLTLVAVGAALRLASRSPRTPL